MSKRSEEKFPPGWTCTKDVKFAHGILITSPEGQNFYSRRAAIESMIKNKTDNILIYIVWNTLHREGWHLGGPLLPWGWRLMIHDSGNDYKYLTGEMIVFLNSSDALKYIVSCDQYDDKDIENFRKWIDEKKQSDQTSNFTGCSKDSISKNFLTGQEFGNAKENPSKKSDGSEKINQMSTDVKEQRVKPTSLAAEIKAELAKNCTPQKVQRARKSNSEEKKRRGKSTPDIDPSTASLLPPGWKYKRNKNSDDFTFITSSRKSLAGSDAVIEFMSSSKSYVAQDIENFIQWREKVNELEASSTHKNA